MKRIVIGLSKLLTGKATVAASLHAERSGCMPAHLLQFSTEARPVVVWNMTQKCNLRCIHCYIEAGDGNSAAELSTDQAILLIRELGEMKVPVLLFSGGEPLLRSDIWKLAEYACASGIRPVLSTNGTLITSEIAKRIRDCGFAYVGISIDGKPETHDFLRASPNSFVQALRGLRNAQAVGLKTGLRFTVNKLNYGDLPYLFDLIEKEGILRFCLYHLVYAGRGQALVKEDLSREEKENDRILHGKDFIVK